jgi:DNA-binding NarL/FixJ family response regulator
MFKILVVDDLQAVRHMLKMQIELDGTMCVTGEAEDDLTAKDLVVSTRPDIVLVDLDMPDLDGINLTKELRSIAPHTPIIALSINDDEILRDQAQQAGASGFIVKQGNTTALRNLIRQVSGR